MKVSVLGPSGSYSEIAAHTFFKTAADASVSEFLLCPSIETVVLRLFEPDENGCQSDCAVIPIENSLEGAVGISMDLLSEKDVTIIAELILPVRHCLLVSKERASDPAFLPEQIDVVYSHPQGLYQCRSFIRKHLKNAELIETDSTSKAALRVADLSAHFAASGSSESTVYAAIASAEAGEQYDLAAVNCSIQDNANNSTRFLFLIRSASLPQLKAHVKNSRFHILPEHLSQTGSGSVFYKTSLIVSPLQDKPGALYHILEAFFLYGINLTRIESRPSKKRLGEYNFYIDFEGSPSEAPIAEALNLVKERSAQVKILGTYGRILNG